ncbi:MAG: hypothetical protein Ct9H90mP20_4010 [Candidatus Neomarinimicrobiota bacterium]|nr:MAG: hypothetical protein Ct9H90mP20_4010 [Candidatus Neomarinimicrobiota bacterium]
MDYTGIARYKQKGFYAVDNPDPEIMGVIPAMENSNWTDGGEASLEVAIFHTEVLSGMILLI